MYVIENFEKKHVKTGNQKARLADVLMQEFHFKFEERENMCNNKLGVQ